MKPLEFVFWPGTTIVFDRCSNFEIGTNFILKKHLSFEILKGAWTGESKERRKNRGSQASGHDAAPFAAVQEWVAAKEVEWHVSKVAEPHD
jgi:hypothetical protein